jgi:hypothetical protein
MVAETKAALDAQNRQELSINERHKVPPCSTGRQSREVVGALRNRMQK